MEAVENIVIVGAGVAGLATALGLHRYFPSMIIHLNMLFKSDIFS